MAFGNNVLTLICAIAILRGNLSKIMFASKPHIVMVLKPMVEEAMLSVNTLTLTVASAMVSVNMLK